jgi:hypothetical protein
MSARRVLLAFAVALIGAIALYYSLAAQMLIVIALRWN